ncbi:MAG: hypothetical protein ACREIT_05130 [Tepidisphaeraceae bacterium]
MPRRLRVMAMVMAWTLLAAGAVGPTRLALAQEEPNPEQLKKMYEDALAQLKAAQDRKNEMSKENEVLAAKLAELTKQIETMQPRLDALEKQAAAYAEQTFNLRSHYAAWQEFMKRYPSLLARWRVFLENDLLTVPNDVPESVVDPNWPFSAQG